MDLENIKVIANSLKGEEAVENIINFVDYPDDTQAGELALKSVTRFFAKARFLTELINQIC